MLKWITFFATVALGMSEFFIPVSLMINASPCLIILGEMSIRRDFASASTGDKIKRSTAIMVVIAKDSRAPGFKLLPLMGRTAFLSPEFFAP
jgi:hypothetical protein